MTNSGYALVDAARSHSARTSSISPTSFTLCGPEWATILRASCICAADREAAYGQAVTVMDQLATHGITHIAIVTDAGKKAAAQQAVAIAPEARK